MNFTGRVGQASCACAAKEETRSARHSRIRFMNSSYQRGLGLLGALVVFSIAVVAGYYVYKGVLGGGGAPTCESAFTAWMRGCQRTRTAPPAPQAGPAARQPRGGACRPPG